MDSLVSVCLLVETRGYFFFFPFPTPLFSFWNANASGCLQARTNYKHLGVDLFLIPPRDVQLHDSLMLEVASGTFSPGLQFQQEQPLAFAAWFKGPLLCGWPDYLMIKWCGAMTLRHDVMGLVVSPAEIQASCCCNLITRWFFCSPTPWPSGRQRAHPIPPFHWDHHHHYFCYPSRWSPTASHPQVWMCPICGYWMQPLLAQQPSTAPRRLIRLKLEGSGYHPIPLFEMIYHAVWYNPCKYLLGDLV